MRGVGNTAAKSPGLYRGTVFLFPRQHSARPLEARKPAPHDRITSQRAADLRWCDRLDELAAEHLALAPDEKSTNNSYAGKPKPDHHAEAEIGSGRKQEARRRDIVDHNLAGDGVSITYYTVEVRRRALGRSALLIELCEDLSVHVARSCYSGLRLLDGAPEDTAQPIKLHDVA